MKKVLTVSIASYNVENTLERAVMSVVEAVNANMVEVLIINDGSTDKTIKIAQGLQSSYPDIVTVVNKDNQGYGSTINKAISIAKGKYFKLLDGDDYFDTSEFDVLLEQLCANDADMIISPYVLVYLNGGSESIVFHNLTNGFVKPEEIDKNIDMHAITYKTEVLKSTAMQLPLRCLYTDALFCLIPMFKVNSLLHVDSKVYQYTLGDELQSVSKRSRINHIEDSLRVFHIALNYYESHSGNPNMEKLILRKINAIYTFCIDSLLLAPVNKHTKKRIITLENELRVKNRNVFIGAHNLKILAMRKSFYKLYPLASFYKRHFES